MGTEEHKKYLRIWIFYILFYILYYLLGTSTLEQNVAYTEKEYELHELVFYEYTSISLEVRVLVVVGL